MLQLLSKTRQRSRKPQRHHRRFECLETRRLLDADPILYRVHLEYGESDWGAPQIRQSADFVGDANATIHYLAQYGNAASGGSFVDLNLTTSGNTLTVNQEEYLNWQGGWWLGWPSIFGSFSVDVFVHGPAGTPFVAEIDTDAVLTNSANSPAHTINYPWVWAGSGELSLPDSFGSGTFADKSRGDVPPLLIDGETYTYAFHYQITSSIDQNGGGNYPYVGSTVLATTITTRIDQKEPPKTILDGPSQVTAGATVILQNLSYDPDNGATPGAGIVNSEWQVDGQSVEFTQVALFQWHTPGTHHITLTVTDDEGQMATVEKTIEVIAGVDLVSVSDQDPRNPSLNFHLDGTFDEVEWFIKGQSHSLGALSTGDHSFTISQIDALPPDVYQIALRGRIGDRYYVDTTQVDTRNLPAQRFSGQWAILLPGIAVEGVKFLPLRVTAIGNLYLRKFQWELPGAQYDRLVVGSTLILTSTVPKNDFFVRTLAGGSVRLDGKATDTAYHAYDQSGPRPLTAGNGWCASYSTGIGAFAKSGSTDVIVDVSGITANGDLSAPWTFGLPHVAFGRIRTTVR